jgi:hypothetical protein
MPSSGAAFLVSEADAAVIVWADRDPDVRRRLAQVERKGLPVHVIGAPEKKPKTVRKREAEPPTREGMLQTARSVRPVPRSGYSN